MPNDEATPPNGDPQEVASADGSQVAASSTEQTPEEASNDRENIEISIRDELAEQFPVETINVGVDPDDGLPTPMDASDAIAIAPGFGPDTVVCIEDEREYVECFSDEELPRGARLPQVVDAALYPADYEPRRARKGLAIEPPTPAQGFVVLRSQYDDDGQRVERRRFEPSRVIEKWGAKFVETVGGLLLVKPRRERCEHYTRMVFANDDPAFKPGEFGHQVLYRNCTRRRSVGGALMSVQDQAVYACEHRDPPDFVSVERFLDGPDRKRIATKVEQVSLFNLKEK